jgi:hypothetical protein
MMDFVVPDDRPIHDIRTIGIAMNTPPTIIINLIPVDEHIRATNIHPIPIGDRIKLIAVMVDMIIAYGDLITMLGNGEASPLRIL